MNLRGLKAVGLKVNRHTLGRQQGALPTVGVTVGRLRHSSSY